MTGFWSYVNARAERNAAGNPELAAKLSKARVYAHASRMMRGAMAAGLAYSANKDTLSTRRQGEVPVRGASVTLLEGRVSTWGRRKVMVTVASANGAQLVTIAPRRHLAKLHEFAALVNGSSQQ